MRSTTRDLIEELKALPWFASSGQDTVDVPTWILATSKSEAVASAEAPEWLKFRLMVSNRMHRDLSQLNYGRFTEWNGLAEHVQKLVTPVIDDAASRWAGAGKVTKAAKLSLAWDIQGMCMEAEFTDQMKPLFFVPQVLECYRSGRRPCGWLGPEIDERWAGASNDPLPAGKLLVF